MIQWIKTMDSQKLFERKSQKYDTMVDQSEVYDEMIKNISDVPV